MSKNEKCIEYFYGRYKKSFIGKKYLIELFIYSSYVEGNGFILYDGKLSNEATTFHMEFDEIINILVSEVNGKTIINLIYKKKKAPINPANIKSIVLMGFRRIDEAAKIMNRIRLAYLEKQKAKEIIKLTDQEPILNEPIINNSKDLLMEKLAYYKMNNAELSIWERFADEVIEECKKMNIESEFFHYVTDILETKPYLYANGYSDLYGYFSVEFGDRGGYTICILTKNMQQASLEFLKRILWSISLKYELQNRHEFEKRWNFSTRYDSRKKSFEYAISKLHQIYDYKEIRDYIAERNDYMNRWFYDEHWTYSEEQNQFIEISTSLEHD